MLMETSTVATSCPRLVKRSQVLHPKMMERQILYSLFFLALVVLFHHQGGDRVSAEEFSCFVGTNGSQFMLNGSTFYLNGFNAYWMMLVAYDPAERVKVTSALEQASRSGLTVARTWAFNDGDFCPLQLSPGSYDQVAFKGLDFVVSEAKRNGIYLIMSLVNNYAEFGGRPRYVRWARERGQNLSSDEDFYTNDMIKGFYKNHVKTVLTRVNTITGMAYKDDPTIFAWELINEPRCETDLPGRTLQDWITEMAAYVKSIDNSHLLEVGLEGFYGESSNPERRQLNPHGLVFGSDFIPNNQISGIDFATIHAYPDSWFNGTSDESQLSYLRNWTEAHVQDTANLVRKPLLITEFGKSLKDGKSEAAQRNAFVDEAYSMIYESAQNGGPLGGGLFWQLLAPGMDKLRDGYEIVLPESPTTAGIILRQSQRLQEVNHSIKHR